ncbi:hypothetical protein Bca4012_091890 [Brassica carinata]
MVVGVLRKQLPISVSLSSAHFPSATNDPISTASLVPLNCSSSLNSVIRRCDTKLPFARQASSEQGFFMRQASTDQPVPQTGGISLKTSVIRRGDNRLYFARQASSAQGLFMRLASTDQRTIPQDAASTKSFAIPSSTEQPLLSRPEYAPPQLALTFPRTVWSPRSNVAEYEHNYVMAVELPGGSINDIRVEGDAQLSVKKLMQAPKVQSADITSKRAPPLYAEPTIPNSTEIERPVVVEERVTNIVEEEEEIHNEEGESSSFGVSQTSQPSQASQGEFGFSS